MVRYAMTVKRFSWRLGCCTAAAILVSVAHGQSLSAKYGTRAPGTCGSTKEPAKGVLSAQQAVRYLTCNLEKEIGGNQLYLLENIKVEVGKALHSFNCLPSNAPALPIPTESSI